MNYYNPYFYGMTYPQQMEKIGFLGKIFNNPNITFSSIINGTQKTLNIVNQTIPIVKQFRPMINNTKTMLKIMNEFKKNDIKTNIKHNYNFQNDNNIIENRKNEKYFSTTTNNPTFFL